MDAREQRGLVIAATTKVQDADGTWTVPSQSGHGQYTVKPVYNGFRCNCPDFETRGVKCKHIHAVEYTMQRESITQVETNVTTGETTVTQTEKVVETVKVTYGQDWKAYNAAQTNEKRLFLSLLFDLCRGIPEPVQVTGRPRLSRSDMIFAAAYKIYSTVSARRFMTDLMEAQDKGYMTKTPHFNSIFNYLELPEVTPILQALIQRSSLPLKAIETDFAVDSSGFGTSRFVKWFDVKHNGEVSHHDWIKLHVMSGVTTNIVTSVEVTGRDAHDAPQFPGLVATTAKNFAISEVSADKAYSSRKNLTTVDNLGGTAFIAFKKNATGKGTATGNGEGCELWSKMFHYYSYRKDEFFAHYHKRSNSETTFSMIKAKFGDSLRSKTTTAQINEALCKVLCHNICVVIQSMYELGVDPQFAEAA